MSVTLVGAGPGDPGLITVRGLERLRACDAVVYDRLVAEELVEEAPADALRICRDGLTQGRQAADGHVLLAVGVGAEGLDDAVGHGEGRLPEAELEHLTARGEQVVAALVDRHCGRGGEAADLQVEADALGHGRHPAFRTALAWSGLARPELSASVCQRGTHRRTQWAACSPGNSDANSER